MDSTTGTNSTLDALYASTFKDINLGELQYDSLNSSTQSYFRYTTSTVVYMSICLSCTVWQILTAAELAYKVRKWLHFAVLFETFLSLITILSSVLNPVTPVSCEFVGSLHITKFLLVFIY
jgi:hypothetical protein